MTKQLTAKARRKCSLRKPPMLWPRLRKWLKRARKKFVRNRAKLNPCGKKPCRAERRLRRAVWRAAAAAAVLGKKSRANPVKSGITSAAGSIATDLAGPIAGRFVRNLIGGLMR